MNEVNLDQYYSCVVVLPILSTLFLLLLAPTNFSFKRLMAISLKLVPAKIGNGNLINQLIVNIYVKR